MKVLEFKKDVFQIITDLIISKLDAGYIPWKKPWSTFGEAKNYITKKPYKGINSLILNCYDFDKPYYLTFKQATVLGGNVKKGSKSIPVVFWNFTYTDKITGKKIKESELLNYPLEQISKSSYLKYYSVFNVADIENIDFVFPSIESKINDKISACEEIVNQMPQRPEIKITSKDRAYYSPCADYVHMPEMKFFDNSEFFYSVLFHELVHSTGHPRRLNRKELVKMAAFGSESYSKEELTAEIGAAFLCGYAEIAIQTITESAAYVQSWIKVLKNDKKFLFEAAARAQNAADFIRNVKYNEAGE